MYLILTTPSNISYVINTAFHVVYDSSSHEAAVVELTWASVAICVYFSNASNFILYMVSGKEFRAEFKAMLVETSCYVKTKMHFSDHSEALKTGVMSLSEP